MHLLITVRATTVLAVKRPGVQTTKAFASRQEGATNWEIHIWKQTTRRVRTTAQVVQRKSFCLTKRTFLKENCDTANCERSRTQQAARDAESFALCQKYLFACQMQRQLHRNVIPKPAGTKTSVSLHRSVRAWAGVSSTLRSQSSLLK